MCVKFLHSDVPGPDHITAIALEDVRRAGVGEFLDQQAGVETMLPQQPQRSLEYLEKSLRRLLDDRPLAAALSIESFLCVTLCTPQRPDLLIQARRTDRSRRRLIDMTAGLERRVRFLESEDFPLLQLASLVNSRLARARIEQMTLRFLKLTLAAMSSDERQQEANWATLFERLGLNVNAQEVIAQGNGRSAYEARCLLWLLNGLMRQEKQLVDLLCNILGTFRRVAEQRNPTPLLLKVASPLWMPHLLIWRLTFDVAEDVAAAFQEDHSYLLVGIPELVRASREIAFAHVVDDSGGGLLRYMKRRGRELEGHDEELQVWLKDLIEGNEGTTFEVVLGRLREAFNR